MWLTSVVGVAGGRGSLGVGARLISLLQLNIFMALSVLVDQRRMTPSWDPDAKKFSKNSRKDNQ